MLIVGFIFYLWLLHQIVMHEIVKVACVVEISFFWPFQKQRGSIFVTSLRFCFAIQSLSYQKVSSKKNLRLLAELSTKNSYFRVKIFCFDKLQLPIKISKEISLSVKCSQIRILVNYDLTRFGKYWSNIAVFSYKIPGHKTHSNVAFKL